jgi:hypothetical protein
VVKRIVRETNGSFRVEEERDNQLKEHNRLLLPSDYVLGSDTDSDLQSAAQTAWDSYRVQLCAESNTEMQRSLQSIIPGALQATRATATTKRNEERFGKMFEHAHQVMAIGDSPYTMHGRAKLAAAEIIMQKKNKQPPVHTDGDGDEEDDDDDEVLRSRRSTSATKRARTVMSSDDDSDEDWSSTPAADKRSSKRTKNSS